MGTESAARCEQACAMLPPRFRASALQLPEHQKARVEEFRLRVGQRVTMLLGEGELPLPYYGAESRLTPEDLRQMLDALTDYSRYACAETLRQGYLCLRGGFRLGICGTAVMREGKVASLRDVSSLALRIVTERIGIAELLLPQLYAPSGIHSTLIVSPPGGGKTTLLRDMIRALSMGDDAHAALRVAVIDERGELAVMSGGVPQMTLGTHTDVLDACPKRTGIGMVLRAMNPQVIAVDEITMAEDVTAIERAANCGASLLATMHAASAEELRRKRLYPLLKDAGVFSRMVVITRQGTARQYRVEEFL